MHFLKNNEHFLAMEKDGFVNIPSFFDIEQMRSVTKEVQLLLNKELKLSASSRKDDPGPAKNGGVLNFV